MARGSYLGKISAIVSVNTASVRPSLNTAAKDVDQWAKKADSSIRGAAQSYERALKGIFTPLQRLQAAIKTANSNPLSFQIQNAQAFTQLAKATEQIAKPLGQVQAQFAGLASSVQTELLPVLQSAQKQTTSLFNAISSGAKVSDRDLENTAARVQRLTAAIARANEAQSLARGGRTGRELAFVAPRVQDELSRSAQLSQRASEAPVAVRADPGFKQRVEELDQLRQGIVRYQAAVERRQVLGLDTKEAQAQLDTLIRRSGDARRALEQVTTGSDSQLIARAKAQQEFYAESERLQKQAATDAAAPLIARAKAEQEFYAESKRLQEQAAQDEAAVLIARAKAQQDFYAESERLQKQAAADSAAPLIARARAEQEYYAESERLQKQAAADSAAPLIARARAEQEYYAESERLQKQAAADEATPLIARARAEQEYYAESQRLQKQAAADAAAPLIARARAEQEYYAESQRLQKQAAADEAAPLIARARAEQEYYTESRRLQSQAAADAAAPLIARARAEQDYYAESERLQKQAAVDAAAPLIARARAEQNYYAESERLQKQAAADSAAPLIARARAEQDYYAESQRLQKQAASDAAAPLIARARAEQDFYAESQRLQKQAAADEAAILIARARAQQDFEAERDRLQKQAAADDVAPVIRRAQADRATAIDFGLDIDAPKRQIEVLRGSIVSLKGQLDTLPVTLRTQFVPAILEAERNLERLALQPAAAAEEIERAAEELNRLSAAASRASSLIGSFGGAGASGITSGLDSRVVQGFTSQLQVLQGVIAGVAGAARNDLAAAFDGVRQSIVSAMTDGTIATRATQESIDASIQSLARMAATASNQNVGRVLTQIARAGDIGRRGLDRFALAAQQAGFAIDDFFSVTGGLDQRIRAVSNNITQLAFIIGSTKGLFIGLSVVIGTQVVLAISKWINSGRTLEDNSKALNDTLARQKSLVEALAESFRALGDALTQGTLSGQASDARDFAESLNRARKARKDLNDEAVLQNDPVVRRERANQARIERELQNAGDQGTVTQLQTQLEESRRRERVRRGVLVQPAPGANEVEDVLRRRAPNPFRRNVPNLADGGELSALRERRAALEGPLDRLRQIITEGPSFFDGGFRFNAASQSFDEINSLAARLDSAISNAVDGIADDLANSSRGPAATIRNAQQEVADAIEAGVPGARRLGVLVDQVGNEFQDAIKALEAAVAITDPAERERAIADARSRLDSVRGRRSDIEARADAVRKERTLNPERNIDAVLSRTQSEIDRIGAPANALRSQLRELQFQRDTVRAQLEAAPADPVLIRAEQELTRALISLEGAVGDLSFDAAEASRLRGDPERGRTLSMTPAERAAEEIQQGLNDIQARFQAVAENVTGIVDTAGMEEAQARFMEDQRRQLAPAVFALQDAVQNAILQGPSRAALNAADVTTMEGSRELNRLLRGDDPAKDVNLLELQKQTQLLEDSLEEQRKLAERFGGVVA